MLENHFSFEKNLVKKFLQEKRFQSTVWNYNTETHVDAPKYDSVGFSEFNEYSTNEYSSMR